MLFRREVTLHIKECLQFSGNTFAYAEKYLKYFWSTATSLQIKTLSRVSDIFKREAHLPDLRSLSYSSASGEQLYVTRNISFEIMNFEKLYIRNQITEEKRVGTFSQKVVVSKPNKCFNVKKNTLQNA